MKTFDFINLDAQEVQEFIDEQGLQFICDELMRVTAPDEDFDKLITRFPEIDYIETGSNDITIHIEK